MSRRLLRRCYTTSVDIRQRVEQDKRLLKEVRHRLEQYRRGNTVSVFDPPTTPDEDVEQRWMALENARKDEASLREIRERLKQNGALLDDDECDDDNSKEVVYVVKEDNLRPADIFVTIFFCAFLIEAVFNE